MNFYRKIKTYLLIYKVKKLTRDRNALLSLIQEPNFCSEKTKSNLNCLVKELTQEIRSLLTKRLSYKG